MKKKQLWQSRTLWVAILQGALGIVMVLQLERPELGGLLLLKSALDMLLRALTTKPLDL